MPEVIGVIERERRAVGRGIQLACEVCDFTATLRERAPFGAEPDNGSDTVSDHSSLGAGYWEDELCGECRLPVRRAHYTSGGVSEPEPSVCRCPRCGGETMPFEVALRELAEACHSRVRVDLANEQRARTQIERTLALTPALMHALVSGDLTTLDAIDTLSRSLVEDVSDGAGPSVSRAMGPLTSTHTLGDLQDEIEHAASIEAARDTLRARLEDSAGYIHSLEACVEDESYLPGTPCPQCETGRLIHWPIWT